MKARFSRPFHAGQACRSIFVHPLARLVRVLPVLTGIILVPAAAAQAAIVAPTLNWEASLDGTANADWESAVNQTGVNTEWSFSSGVVIPGTAGPPSNLPGVTAWYSFPAAGATMPSFQVGKPGGNLTGSNVSFELIFRPRNFSGKHVLFETGGNADGLSFTIDNSTLNFIVQDANSNSRRVIKSYGFAAGDVDLLHQFIATVDVDPLAGAHAVRLFHDGAEVGLASSASGVLSDWGGGSGSGVGQANGSIPLGAAGTYSSYDGDIALLRYYPNALLTPGQVLANYSSVSQASIPEPATMILLVLGLTALAGSSHGARAGYQRVRYRIRVRRCGHHAAYPILTGSARSFPTRSRRRKPRPRPPFDIISHGRNRPRGR